jgi:hypothetical protein
LFDEDNVKLPKKNEDGTHYLIKSAIDIIFKFSLSAN